MGPQQATTGASRVTAGNNEQLSTNTEADDTAGFQVDVRNERDGRKRPVSGGVEEEEVVAVSRWGDRGGVSRRKSGIWLAERWAQTLSSNWAWD